MTPVALATLKILIWFISMYHLYRWCQPVKQTITMVLRRWINQEIGLFCCEHFARRVAVVPTSCTTSFRRSAAAASCLAAGVRGHLEPELVHRVLGARNERRWRRAAKWHRWWTARRRRTRWTRGPVRPSRSSRWATRCWTWWTASAWETATGTTTRTRATSRITVASTGELDCSSVVGARSLSRAICICPCAGRLLFIGTVAETDCLPAGRRRPTKNSVEAAYYYRSTFWCTTLTTTFRLFLSLHCFDVRKTDSVLSP